MKKGFVKEFYEVDKTRFFKKMALLDVAVPKLKNSFKSEFVYTWKAQTTGRVVGKTFIHPKDETKNKYYFV